MEKCTKYLKKLKKLYSNFDSLKDTPFIVFSIEAVDLLNKIKMDIENNYMNESNETFIKYSNLIKDKLDGLSYDRTKGLIIEIEKWLLKYNYHYNYESYSIETILSLDPESAIYSDLSFPINMLQTDSIDADIFDLQNDFLFFCKKMIAEDIINHLNGINQEKGDNPLPIYKKEKVSDSLMLNGHKLNLAERFKIINDQFNISKEISKLNISENEKYQLVSYVLGCSTTNARQVMNGNYNGKIRNGDIKNYIESLNK